MRKVSLSAVCEAFTVKAPKQGKKSAVVVKWWVVDADPSRLAALCSMPKEAEAAMKQCGSAGGKMILPCRADLYTIAMRCEDAAHEVHGATLREVSMDCTGTGFVIMLSCEHPDKRSDIDFYYDGRGLRTELAISPAQGTLPGAEE